MDHLSLLHYRITVSQRGELTKTDCRDLRRLKSHDMLILYFAADAETSGDALACFIASMLPLERVPSVVRRCKEDSTHSRHADRFLPPYMPFDVADERITRLQHLFYPTRRMLPQDATDESETSKDQDAGVTEMKSRALSTGRDRDTPCALPPFSQTGIVATRPKMKWGQSRFVLALLLFVTFLTIWLSITLEEENVLPFHGIAASAEGQKNVTHSTQAEQPRQTSHFTASTDLLCFSCVSPDTREAVFVSSLLSITVFLLRNRIFYWLAILL